MSLRELNESESLLQEVMNNSLLMELVAENKPEKEPNTPEEILASFESAKYYQRYFKKGNNENVIQRLKSRNYTNKHSNKSWSCIFHYLSDPSKIINHPYSDFIHYN